MIEKYRGSLLGLAIGDAMGAPIEFKPPNQFERVENYRSGGVFQLEAGYWTDDTSQALCIAHSLIKNNKFNALDIMNTFKRWWSEEAFLSSINEAFGLGRTTSDAFRNFDRTNEPYSGRTDQWASGNGSIMRLAPIPLFFMKHPKLSMEMAVNSSRLTHGSKQCKDSCRMLNGLIIGSLQGVSKKILLSDYYNPISATYWEQNPAEELVDGILQGNYKNKEPAIYEEGRYVQNPIKDIKGKGHVIETLRAALWAFHTTDNFKDGLLKVINLGDDADTTGAVYGQLAGAFYGQSQIPSSWIKDLAHRELIIDYANKLYERSLII